MVVLNMLAEIGDASNVPKFLARASNPDDPFRLMGFGHRVYKNYDPRASSGTCAMKYWHNRETGTTPCWSWHCPWRRQR